MKEADGKLRAVVEAQGQASRDRDHAIEKRIDDLRDDLRLGNRTSGPSPVIVAAER